MAFFELQLGLAVLLDLLFGDPRWFPHPIRLIGVFCTTCEAFFRKLIQSEILAGILTVLSVLLLTVGCTASLLATLSLYSLLLAQCLAIALLYTTLAARDLVVHSRAVYDALLKGDSLEPARKAVAQIVGRDTAGLDQRGIIRACVETVAENMVDGVTAPLFYAVCFSLLAPFTAIDPLFLAVCGAMGYKAVNTMDSMFGYKNEKYLFFGRCAARVDDLVNFIPARLSGFILIPAAFFLGLQWKDAFTVLKRDRLAHASPNAAHPEAAVSGALGIELGGVSLYFGKEVVKPCIGDPRQAPQSSDILHTNKLMLLGSFFFLILLLTGRFILLQVLP